MRFSVAMFKSVFHCAVSNGRFVALYESLVSCGKIRPDPRQIAVVNLLQNLGSQLEGQPGTPRGLYIVGGCGTGKTMLMDLFYSNVEFPKKKRVHFHEYMIDVHSRLFKLQKLVGGDKCDLAWTFRGAEAQRRDAAKIGKGPDPLERVADQLVAEATLVCFDEFQVTHISDAVIIRRLFSVLFDHGVVVVATSNRPPDDLYIGGLNRDLFTPFIPVLKKFCLVHNMDSETDYRQLTVGSVYSVFVHSDAELESKFFNLACNKIDTSQLIEVQGRSIPIRRVATESPIAWFTFKELCDTPLGAADYLKIAKKFHTVFIQGIPLLTINERDQLRRFISLIDAFYDHGTRLVFSSPANDVSEIFAHEPEPGSNMDEVFAWDRTVSRLTEMISEEYQIRHIRKLLVADFYGQFDLTQKLGEENLRTIFVRYDKNNDSVIAVPGLNRMLNELGKTNLASETLIESLTGSPKGKRIHFDKFKQYVDKHGILHMQ